MCTSAATLRLVYELIRANKDFDMLLIPEGLHGQPRYADRKRWDYFVEHLLHADPPSGYHMISTRTINGLEY